MTILQGTMQDGTVIPVQVDAQGRLVAEGLPGVAGPEGPPGGAFELPANPKEGEVLAWVGGNLAWIASPAPKYLPAPPYGNFIPARSFLQPPYWVQCSGNISGLNTVTDGSTESYVRMMRDNEAVQYNTQLGFDLRDEIAKAPGGIISVRVRFSGPASASASLLALDGTIVQSLTARDASGWMAFDPTDRARVISCYYGGGYNISYLYCFEVNGTLVTGTYAANNTAPVGVVG